MALLKKDKIQKSRDVSLPRNTEKGVSAMHAQNVIKRPWVSEKAQNLHSAHQYAFLVHPDANKKSVSREVEKRYGVNVVSVNITNIKGKMKRFRHTQKRGEGVKKALVTIKSGQKIEII